MRDQGLCPAKELKKIEEQQQVAVCDQFTIKDMVDLYFLGHSKKGIEGTYNLHRYEDECHEWLQRWADHLDDLLDSTKYANGV